IIRNLPGQLVGRRQQLTRFVDTADQPALERFLSAEYPAGMDPLSSLHGADKARQEPAGTGLHGDTPASEDEAELGVGRGQTDIHRQGHGYADTYRRAVEGADHRLGALVDTQRHRTAAIAQIRAFRLIGAGVAVEGITALLQVGTRAESAAGAGHYDYPHRIIGVRCIKGGEQLTTHGAIEGVHPVGAVEGQGEDAILYLIIEGFKLHGDSADNCSGWESV